jgi:hypothetical protein
VSSAKHLSQLIYPTLNRRRTINGSRSLDAGVSHLGLNHVQRHMAGNGPDAKSVVQLMGGDAA